MAERKTLYHSELVRLGPVRVTVASDVLESTKRKGSWYVTLNINGEDRYYNPENQACLDFWLGQKGRTFTIIALGGGKGKEDTAGIHYVGEAGETVGQQPAPKAPAGPAPRPQAASPAPGGPAAPRGPVPHENRPQGQPSAGNAPSSKPAQAAAKPPAGPAQGNGQRVGMALNKAIDYMIAEAQPWNPTEITNRASDILRIADWLEAGHRAPDLKARMQKIADASRAEQGGAQ